MPTIQTPIRSSRHRRYGVVAVPLALGALMAGCGSGGSSSDASTGASTTATPAAPAASGPAKVTIASYKFGPASLTVKPGTKITFTNTDASEHTATDAGTPGFDSGTLKKGDSKAVTFSKAGTYAYICSFHPFMHGTIVVQ